LTSASTTGNASVQAAIQEAQAAKASANNAFDTTSQGFNSGLNQKLTDATNNATTFNKNFNDITARLSGASATGNNNGIQQLTPDEQAALGMSNSALNRYASADDILSGYGRGDTANSQLGAYKNLPAATPMSLASYLTGGNTSTLPTGLASVANDKDYQEAAALSALGGGKYSSPLDPANAAQAGTYKPNGNYQTFDTTKANGLFDTVNAYDKATAGDPSKYTLPGGTYDPATGQPMAKDYGQAYQSFNDQISKAAPGSYDQNQFAILNALNRLANGFDAPASGYTPPTNVPPSLGGGINPNPPAPTPNPGPGRVAR
jgi:hypothetical protein